MSRDRGAAAVEFALVLPILIALAFGAIEFGYLMFLNSAAAGAAREGVRAAAISGKPAEGSAHAQAVFKGMTGRDATASFYPKTATCVSGEDVEVILWSEYSLTTFFAPTFTASGKAVMRCGG